MSVGREINFPTTDGRCRQNTHSHDTFVHVLLITAGTAQIFHSRNTRGSSRLPWCVKSSLSFQRHVSHVAALATEHFHTISLTYITCPPTIFCLSPVLSRPILDWIMKPCETLDGVADTLNLHLPQKRRRRRSELQRRRPGTRTNSRSRWRFGGWRRRR